MARSVTVELDDQALENLNRLAERTSRSRDELIVEAVQDYLSLHAWQIEKIAEGIAAANREEFVDEEEIARIAAKYSARA
jgi:predicted transcriptional regulator